MFRATGRFVWMLCYIVFFACMYIINKYEKKKVANFIIILCLILQIIDFYPSMKRKFEYKEKVYNIDNTNWEYVMQDVKHIVYLNFDDLSFDENRTSYYIVAYIAYQNDCTLNNFYFARKITNVKETNEIQIQKLKSGEIDENTLYIIRQKDKNNMWWNENLDNYNIDEYIVVKNKQN